MKETTVAIVCASCPAGASGLAERLKHAVDFAGLPIEVQETECMSGCSRPSSLAFRAPGKTTYLFGDISDADLPHILTFCRLYLASADGTFSDARPLGDLRLKAVARIPG